MKLSNEKRTKRCIEYGILTAIRGYTKELLQVYFSHNGLCMNYGPPNNCGGIFAHIYVTNLPLQNIPTIQYTLFQVNSSSLPQHNHFIHLFWVCFYICR